MMKRLSIFALSLFLVLSTPLGVRAVTPVRNIVLVHGAFADGSSWSKVIPLLQGKGYTVVAVQNPLSSLGDDVAATKRADCADERSGNPRGTLLGRYGYQ
jgi:pimeloyl-ACP methyl ester carboxylesterase